MPAKKKPVKAPSDKKPTYTRLDVVRVTGIPSPLMLVTGVSEEPEEDNAEFTVNVIFFNSNSMPLDDDFGGRHQFAEGLLQLVKPAAQVVAEAEAATKEARGQF